MARSVNGRRTRPPPRVVGLRRGRHGLDDREVTPGTPVAPDVCPRCRRSSRAMLMGRFRTTFQYGSAPTRPYVHVRSALGRAEKREVQSVEREPCGDGLDISVDVVAARWDREHVVAQIF